MPFWFRAAAGFLFAVLLIPYVLLRGGSMGSALAKAAGIGLARPSAPVLAAERALSLRSNEPANGAYTLNGMLVRYRTYPVPAGPDEAVSRFEAAFRKAGYRTKEVSLGGQRTLVGVHPETKMMLTMRPGHDRRGRPTVRLSEQDLSRLDASFRAEIPSVPNYPGATRKMLVKWVEGGRSTALAYVITSSAESVARFYLQEMKIRGWERLVPPAQAPFSGTSVVFFQKGEQECSVVVMPDREAGDTVVLVTVGRAGERTS